MVSQNLKILHIAFFLSELSVSSWSVPALTTIKTTRVTCVLITAVSISCSVKHLVKKLKLCVILLDLTQEISM